MASSSTRLENQILHFSSQKKWDKVEALWPQIVEAPPGDAKFYAQVADRLVRAGKVSEVKSWLGLLVESCATGGQERLVINVCRGGLRALPEFPELREFLLSALRSHYADQPRLEEFLAASGLDVEAALYKPLNRFLQFVYCAEGEVFQHSVWGVGKVVSVDTQAGRAVIHFPSQGEKSFSFEGVREFLKKIPRSHLFAQRLLAPKALAERAEKKPAEFLKYCLKSLGGEATQSQLKEHLTQGVFSPSKWSSWWNRNRDAFRFDPYIGLSGASGNARLVLREEPKSFYEEILDSFLMAETLAQRCALVDDILKHRDAEPIPEETLVRMIDAVETGLSAVEPDRLAERVESSFLIEDLQVHIPGRKPHQGPSSGELLDQAPNPVETVCAMSIPDNQIRACRRLKEFFPVSWPERAEQIFMSGPARLGQWILRDLTESGMSEVAGHIAEQLLHRPYENPNLFLWLIRAARSAKIEGLSIDSSPSWLVPAVVGLIDDCQRRIEHEDPESTPLKGLKARLQNLLMENHHAILGEYFEAFATADQAREAYRSLMENASLGATFKISAEHALRLVRDDLEEGARGATDEHFVTAEAFERKQKEYFNIKNVLIPENSKAIGAAAAEGDLRENAAYAASKDRQKVLFRQVESLETLLHSARVIDLAHVSTDEIGFGTSFDIKNTGTGGVETYTLLGMWEAEPERGVLSYLTPFGQQFLKKKVGDVLVVNRPGGDATNYQVLAISNALADKPKA
ncbi:GreA/GreB family elongation factor [Candidatus Sumerlaeota bacterium]|nr:GreA/GreB family elongation factor [Candidatus Sumerlaeota bacterium]